MTVSLTPQQQDAVDQDGGAFLVIAPPGSGKTEVLVRRIGRLLAESAAATFRILALTFTNHAAEDLRTRVGAEVAGEEPRLFAGTFHHFCLEVLRNHGRPVGVTPDVTIYSGPAERLEVLEQALLQEGYQPGNIGLTGTVGRAILTRLDELRAQSVQPSPESDEEFAALGLPVALVYAAYDRALDRFGGLDFPAMLTRAVRLLTDDEWARKHYQRLYRYVLVDEAQDMTPVQYELLRAVCRPGLGNVFVVADRNQSIYAFNSAAPERLLPLFRQEYGATELQLDSNFRSAEAIISAANQLSAHFRDPGRAASMVQHGTASGHIELVAYPNEAAEAVATADWLAGLIEDGLDPRWLEGEDSALRLEDVAILSRTRYGLDALITTLGERGVPHLLRTGEAGLFDSTTGQRVQDALRVLANPRDIPTQRRLLAEVASEHPPSYDTQLDIGSLLGHLAGILPDPAVHALRRRSENALDDGALIAAIEAVDLPETDDAGERDRWQTDKALLARCWRRYLHQTPPRAATLAGLLGLMARLQRATVDEPGVRLLTVHAAKGLEFRAVAIVNFAEGSFPHYRSTSPAEIEEERRNAYVAITRAARVLRLSYPLSRNIPKRGPQRQRPSRFLKEMGLEA